VGDKKGNTLAHEESDCFQGNFFFFIRISGCSAASFIILQAPRLTPDQEKDTRDENDIEQVNALPVP
jgi:hypothetical protein